MNRTIHNFVLQDTVTFVKTSAGTAGAETELEAAVMAGACSPSHFHTPYDETISAIEGGIELPLSKGSVVQLAPRESYTIRAGPVRCLRNGPSAAVRVRSQIVPGGEGFGNGLRILYGLASDGMYNDKKIPAGLQAFVVCLAMSDTKLSG